MESTPPLSPRSRRSPAFTSVPSRASTWAAMSFALLLRFDFLELAITDQPLEARFQKLIQRLVSKLPPVVLQCLFQALHHRFMVAMGTAKGLVHDLVDQAQ